MSLATSRIGTREEAPEETRADVRAHRFWRQVTTVLFYICIVNLDASSYLCIINEKVLVKYYMIKKDIHLQDCLESIRHFTPLVLSSERISGKEARVATWKMVSHLRFKLNIEYYIM